MNFAPFKRAIAAQFAKMQQHRMFRVNIAGDELWLQYLAAFPEGTNPMYRKRTEHDCSCCRQFIKTVGDAVAIIDGKLVSIWDINTKGSAAPDGGYLTVAEHMADLVKSKPIVQPFLHYEKAVGTEHSFEALTGGDTMKWEHFHVNIDSKFVVKKDSLATILGQKRTAYETLVRALDTITDDAVDTVLELISQNSLYRGEEHARTVGAFKVLQQQLATVPDRMLMCWDIVGELPGAVSGIRNSSIGTLLVDLSEGRDIESAVKAFESKVAPANYKRPTALVTKAMIDKAKVTVAELGLTSALQRRYAVLTDLTINNVLFADRSTRKALGDDVFDALAAETSSRATPSVTKVEEVPISKFITDVLPLVQGVEVFFENRHTSNLVSLIAPTDPTAGRLFKWNNPFSWSYSGEFADAIKERVKAAGGNVTGDLCCRLAWDYTDDLDFHMYEPGGGANAHIYYIRLGYPSANGGMLDVDANGCSGLRKEPVENIFYGSRATMREGVYELKVNNYNRRSEGRGFVAEIEFDGNKHTFEYAKALRNGETVSVAKIKYTRAKGFEIIESMPSTTTPRMAWGLPTQTYHKVNAIMLSPNHWDGEGVGNKHFFFMLEGCVNDGTARGFYNEFLDSRLDPHRKVLEMVGSKLKPADSAHQLSGVGFSSTARNHVLCRVTGSYQRTLKVIL